MNVASLSNYAQAPPGSKQVSLYHPHTDELLRSRKLSFTFSVVQNIFPNQLL